VLFVAQGIGFGQGWSFTDRRVPGMSQADVHNPFSRGYVDMTPFGRTRYYSSGPGFYGHSHHGHFHSGLHFGGASYWDYGYYAAPPYRLDLWQPPLLPQPPLAFGGGAGGNLPPIGAGQGGPIAPQLNPAPKPAKPRVANPEAVARAARLLSAGDEQFAAQRYRDANAQYRTATETAGDLVEAFFRRGQALLAMNQYELAGDAFKRGLRLGDKWPQASFDLAELYGENQVAKVSHLEAVAAAAEERPLDGTLLLMVALQLHFDGQQERSLPFFRKAAELLPGDELNLSVVLRPAK
jgi:tetratricopeptide (TPR) repeat protein